MEKLENIYILILSIVPPRYMIGKISLELHTNVGFIPKSYVCAHLLDCRGYVVVVNC